MATEITKTETVSKIISRGMQLIGKNAYISWVSKSMVQISDAIWRWRIGRKQHSGGSSSEGTTTSASDVDRMIVERNIIVLTTPTNRAQDDPNTVYLQADSSKSNNGYVRLILANTDKVKHEIYGNLEHVTEETPEGKCLSCDKFVEFIASLAPKPEDTPYSAYRHGPCITVDHHNVHGYAPGKTPSDVIETDTAFALKCNEWPPAAQEWFDRERKHGWPTQKLIDKMRQLSCHAVPVGDPTSEHPALEWRLSFLLAERQLIWSFNDTQILCYVILKYLRKRLLEPLAPDQISSYHLKTVVFWLSEENGLDDWNERNLIPCIRNCLSHLRICADERKLQHYFFRDNNLFRHKLKNPSDRQRVTEKLLEIENDAERFVLDSGLSENCRSYLVWHRLSSRDVDRFIEISSSDIEVGDYFPLCKKVNDTRRRYQAMSNTCFNIADCLDPLEFLCRVTDEFEKELPDDIDQVYVQNIKHFLDIRIGITMHRTALEKTPPSEDFRNGCEQRFVDGANSDAFTGKLYLANYHLCYKKYSKCRELVTDVLQNERRFIYFGHCSMKPGLEVVKKTDNEMVIEQTPDVPVTGEDDEELFPAFDMLFTKEDANFVPYPLKFECGLFKSFGERVFAVHPAVYAYTLMYFAHFFERDGESATALIPYLETLIQESSFTYQRFRALNILGFCYGLSGNFDKAIACYSQSLRDSSTHLQHVTNAAAFHLANLLFGIYVAQYGTRK